MNLTGVDAPDRLIGTFITANTFTILGARAERGPPLHAGGGVGAGRAARGGALARRVGVALRQRPEHHRPDDHAQRAAARRDRRALRAAFHDPQSALEVFLPISSAPQPNWAQRGGYGVWTIAKMKPGVTLAQAQQDLSTIMARLAKEFPETNNGFDANLIPLKEMVVGAAAAGAADGLRLRRRGPAHRVRERREPPAGARDVAPARARRCARRSARGAGGSRGSSSPRTSSSRSWAAVAGRRHRRLGDAARSSPPCRAACRRLLEVGIDGRVLAFSARGDARRWTRLRRRARALRRTDRAAGIARRPRPARPERVAASAARDAVVAMQLALCVVLLVGAGLLDAHARRAAPRGSGLRCEQRDHRRVPAAPRRSTSPIRRSSPSWRARSPRSGSVPGRARRGDGAGGAAERELRARDLRARRPAGAGDEAGVRSRTW